MPYFAANDPFYPSSEKDWSIETLVAMNLSSSTSKSDVIEFFEWPGDVVDVRFSYYPSGEFRGVCHIEFATEEAAKKAMKLNGEYLSGSWVKLGFSRESIFVRGFDTSSGINEIRSSLKEHFSSCGEILWMHIPTFHDTGVARGIAFIEFYHLDAFPKAIAMNVHKLGHYPLTIEDATPLNLNVRGTGGRVVSSGGLFGPYGGSTYVHRFLLQSDRGYGRAGLGSKIKFDYDELEGEETGLGACTQSTIYFMVNLFVGYLQEAV
ncbi:hypothetical protein MKW92_008413 [Papaver armeniacum]|nr:hypothetical protein MKW92_008413 [Papaver armeniacum]